MERLPQLTQALIDLDEKGVLALAESGLAAGIPSVVLLQASEAGMRGVGERYERQEYFLSALIAAGEIFREVLELIEPGLREELAGSASGIVLLGTVAGDIHNIGKNIVATSLRSFGFSVEDLGVDVAPERFLERARELHPDVVGLSGLVSASYESMRETVRLLREAEDELGRVPVVLGGGTIDEDVKRFTGADSWTMDAMDGVRICQRLVRSK